jgi:hypothetical protein
LSGGEIVMEGMFSKKGKKKKEVEMQERKFSHFTIVLDFILGKWLVSHV